MSTAKIPVEPFGKIALSCSGGGYRAASFHLGAMAYLNRLRFSGTSLLERVKMISTVSGGTITGVIYALQKQQGKSFEEIYAFVIAQLRSLDLVQLSILTLNPDAVWSNKFKRKNMINAFALLYEKHFTGGATFKELDVMKSHLEAVAFNSTEFANGINFRFRNKGTGFFGNFEIQVPHELAAEVKLSDAMASSSCFTGGFEPLVWPHDFVHDASPNLEAHAKKSDPLGIMDGGIYDNQGIDSLINYKKNAAESYFDLIIISDVASPYMDPFKPAVDPPKTGWRRLTLKQVFLRVRKIERTVSVVLVVALVLFALLPLLVGYGNNFLTGFAVAWVAVTVSLWFAKSYVVRLLKRGWNSLLEGIKKKIPDYFLQRFAKLRVEELSVRRVEPLIIDRVNSLVTLLMDVFLKVIRRLNYFKLYENDRFGYRRVSNLVRELTEFDFNNRRSRETENIPSSATYREYSILHGEYADVVGVKIKEVAESAASFGTTLWFTDKDNLQHMLDHLLASGQFTMCYNLLHYLETLIFEEGNGFAALPAGVQQNLMTCYDQCKADWLHFKEKPMWMVEEMEMANMTTS
jgi:predicted acylesterase/phospholipase RssA